MANSYALHFSPSCQIIGWHPFKAHNLFFCALLASFRPSSDINCEWMQTPVEEYGFQEVCHILSPLGRTFNLLSWGTAPLQVVLVKDAHLPAFCSHSARQLKRREGIWSKWCLNSCRCRIVNQDFHAAFNSIVSNNTDVDKIKLESKSSKLLVFFLKFIF